MPKPLIPFKFKTQDSKEAEDLIQDEVLILKLIALLNAKGVSSNQIIDLIGPEIKNEITKAKNNPSLSKLITNFSVRLNEPIEQRIKKATSTALDKILDILNNPKSQTKDILSAAKDLLDRDLGKATQKIEMTSDYNSNEDLKSIQMSTKAVEDRLKQMSERREAIITSLKSKTPIKIEAEITDV